MIEYIALFDFATDLFVAYKLINAPATVMWAAITVNAMIAPFLASCVQMISFLLEKVIVRDDMESNTWLLIISWGSLFPIFIVFLWIMDIVFIINTTIFEPIASIFGICCNVNFLTQAIDGSYEVLFRMKKHEVAGFKRMRTITQLFFESFLQLALQLHMLHIYQGTDQVEEFGVSVGALCLSISLAVAHLILGGI